MIKKYKIISILSLLALLSPCINVHVYADDNEKYKPTDVTMEDYSNPVTPGFNNEIEKSEEYTDSFISAFNQNEIKKTDNEDENNSSNEDEKSDVYVYYNKPADFKVDYDIVSSCPSTGNRGDFWGQTNDGKWICIVNGLPATGWKNIGGTWYYMDYDGIMQTGWVNVGQYWYYFYPSGAMAYNTWIGNYYLGYNGDMR
ncbi:cell wall-binding protein [Clostridium sp. BJN0001]|uniref:cell wall-binding protein n=1 Tax=Clostridium sp. BJN0001 TaxID=2930219 RepID=UPI001FD353A9|nr:cell wall-binding protein [Clostridium sp. BJN0001]